MNQYSRWALGAGVTSGETVALMMGNRPEYFAIWLGLIQAGRDRCADRPRPSRASGRPCLEGRLRAARHRCSRMRRCLRGRDRRTRRRRSRFWSMGTVSRTARRIDLAVSDQSGEPLAQGERRPVTLADRALRIFTSGTTGLAEGRRGESSQARRLEPLVCRPCWPDGVRPALQLLAYASQRGRRCRAWRAPGFRRVRSQSPSAFRRAAFGTTSRAGSARRFNISANSAAISSPRRSARRRRLTGCGSQSATGFRKKSGAPF